MKTVVKMGIVLLLAVVLCLCLGTAAHAESVIDSGYCGSPNAGRNVQWTLYDTGRLVISGEGEMEGIWTVTQWWNGRQSSIKSLEIRDGVTSVGAHAFHDCTNLTSVTLPESLTTIGYYSFQNCTGLTSITLPSKVNTLLGNAFQGAGLTDITIPAGVTSISNELLRDCKSLKNVTILGNVTVIKSWAFEGCTALEEITIPKSVGEIAYGAFKGCTSLKDFIIPAGVTEIDTDCFRNCTSLESITIPKSVSLVSNEAFDGCTKLADVSFLGSEKQWNAIRIDENNEALKNARHHFSAMDSGVCGDNLSWTLYNDKKLVIEGSGSMANYSEGNAPWYVDIQQILTAEISDDVTSVGDYAFYGCTGLTDVTLPESVASLGAGAFYGCTGLKSITLPQNLTEIGDEAFSGCIKLDGVVLPENLTSLGEGAFSGCASLSEIIVPGGVTSLKSNTFKLCTSLTNAYLLQGVDSIGDEAFSGCTELEFVFLNAQSIGASAFSGCVKLNDVELPEDLTSIGAGAFSGCVKLKDIELPENLTSLGEGAFSGCISLGKFTVPAGVTELKSDTFYGCTGLTEVTLPSELKSIDSAAFRDCTGLTVITIPEKVESIGSDAFSSCTGLREILLPVKLTSIGSGAFYNCGMLTDVFYTGFEQQWKLVSIGSNNEPLTDALIHYDVVPGTYFVTFFANGGTGAPNEQAKMPGTDLALSDVRPIRESENPGSYTVKLNLNDGTQSVYTLPVPRTINHSFRNWNTAADGSGTEYAPGALYTADAHMRLYAQWDSKETAVITLPQLAREGAVFLGWATSRDAESGETGEYHPTGDVTLYAIWRLPDLRLPASLTVVESEAFAGGAFTYVLVPKTVTAIGPRAFADCVKLQYVELLNADTVIDPSAFAGVPDVTIIRPADKAAGMSALSAMSAKPAA